MRAYIQLQMYFSSWDGLLCRKRLSTGVGDNGKSFLLDQDLETSCCATSAKKKRIIGSSCILQQLCWVLLSVFLWIFRYFTRLADPPSTSQLPLSPPGCAQLLLLLHTWVGEKDKAPRPRLCCCKGFGALPHQKRAQLELLSSMPYFGL